MRSRIITGLLIAVTTAVFVLASSLTTTIFLAVVSGFCAWEFYAMLRSDAKLPNELIGTTAAALYPISYYFFGFQGLLSLTTLFALVLLVWYAFYMHARITDVAVTLFGALYTGLMLTSLILIRHIPPEIDFFLPEIWGGVLVFLIIFSTFANDAAAYFVGSKIGKHKMAPRISPKKSWEGFFGGLVASVLLWCLIPLIPGMEEIGWGWVIAGGLLCGIIGVLGDLVESRIKRSTGHKDSSNLLPGHGGFLDRCDSLLLVGAAASILLRFAGSI